MIVLSAIKCRSIYSLAKEESAKHPGDKAFTYIAHITYDPSFILYIYTYINKTVTFVNVIFNPDFVLKILSRNISFIDADTIADLFLFDLWSMMRLQFVNETHVFIEKRAKIAFSFIIIGHWIVCFENSIFCDDTRCSMNAHGCIMHTR